MLPGAALLAVWLHCQAWLEAQAGCGLPAGLRCCPTQQTSLWPCAVLHSSGRPRALLWLLPSVCLHAQRGDDTRITAAMTRLSPCILIEQTYFYSLDLNSKLTAV